MSQTILYPGRNAELRKTVIKPERSAKVDTGRNLMKEIHTEIEITSSPEKVWDVLTNLQNYSQWNPFIKQISGNLQEGEKFNLTIQPMGGKSISLKPRILINTQHKELVWLGHLLVPGLFDGEHHFLIEQLNKSRVRFVQSEYFKGALVPLLWDSIRTGTRLGFIEMNQALKKYCEQ